MAPTPKKQLFLAEFVKDYNATKAAIRAGYSKKTAYQRGFELKNDPSVKAELENIQATLRTQTQMTMDELLRPLVEVHRAKLSDYLDPETGETIYDENSPNQSAVKKITRRTWVNSNGDPGSQTVLELHNAVSVNERLAQLLGLEAKADLELTVQGMQFKMYYPGDTEGKEI